jgi:hypothetical protein
MSNTITISEIFEQFLAEEKARMSLKRFSKYCHVIDLFRICLESYWPGHQAEYDRITKAGGTFCDTFGPKDLLYGYSEFLGYYMSNKVFGSKETKQAAGVVTSRLALWLAAKGYVPNVDSAVQTSQRAGKELPRTAKACEILSASACAHSPDVCDRVIEDHFQIERIEPGRIWLSPITMRAEQIGPIEVPEKATGLLRLNWNIGASVGRVKQEWRFLDVWNVSA